MTSKSEGIMMYELIERIFPFCRSITGNGVRQTLDVFKEYCPEMMITEVPSGTRVFDWTVPKEWNITEGFIEDEDGSRIIDFQKSNLHIMGYSLPIDQWMDLDELKKIIFTLPEQPDLIPYVTSYYNERHGFCMSYKQLCSLKPGKYHAVIKSKLKKGSLSYGEIILPGRTDKEIFISTYICHPSMANNECSGPALSLALAGWVRNLTERRYTFRFVFIPETIGSITYLSKNLKYMKSHVIAGFNISCVGDNRAYSYVASRYGNTLADKAVQNILKHHFPDYASYSYLERGSDERQYNSPGCDLPVCAICRSKYGTYPEYHTSADNMTIISPEGLQGAYDICRKIIKALESNYYYKTKVLCEPQLGKRGLYPTISRKGSTSDIKSTMDFLAYTDGKNDLIDISNIINVSIEKLNPIVSELIKNDIIDKKCEHG